MPIHFSEKAGRAAEILLTTGALGCSPESPFVLAGRWASPAYVDARRPLASASERRELLRLMAEAVREYPFDAVAGGEAPDVPYGALIAELVGLPFLLIRKGGIEGDLKSGDKILLVETAAMDGAPLADAARILRGAGAACEHAVVVFFHGLFPEAPRLLEEAGLALHALATWRHLADAAEASGRFSDAQLRELRAFLADPQSWSDAHGGIC